MVDVNPLRQRIVSTLSARPCRRIDFQINGVRIYWPRYAMVITGLALSPVPGHHFRPLRIGVTHLRPAEARYRPSDNTFLFPHANYGVTPFERQSIVHEATHAAFDIYHSGMRKLDEEAAAYIAEVLFVRYTEEADALDFRTPEQLNQLVPPHITVPPQLMPATIPIRRAADEIAYGIYRTPGVSITANQLAPLRRAILVHPVYRDIRQHPRSHYPNDGVRL